MNFLTMALGLQLSAGV